jgi:twitching motility protein PilT
MEDPLEFVHADKQCFVTQRQIGTDCASFREGLRRALRQDPDVILIGEMRDLETISMAITAAETGHLVFGTLHTTSAVSTVDRIIDVFPTDAQQQVRVQLSTTLQGVVSQTLVPKIGGGRVAAHEIMVGTDAVRALVREGKTTQILNLMQTGKAHGMSTLEDQLLHHYAEGRITADDAVARANRPDDVRKRIDQTPVRTQPAARMATATSGRPGAMANGGMSGGVGGAKGAGRGLEELDGAGPGVQGLKMRRPAARL